MPWAIRMTDEEVARYRGNDWARRRMDALGATLAKQGGHFVLPMIEVDKRLQCIFLDEDHLCGLQKQLGHEGIPAVCQTFPFEFVLAEDGRMTPILSHLCPSIRDNRGRPVNDRLHEKLTQAKGLHFKLPESIALGRSRIASANMGIIINQWDNALSSDTPLPQALADLYDETALLQKALSLEPGGTPIAEDALSRSMAAAAESLRPDTLPKNGDVPPIANVLSALCLSLIAYPARVKMPHRVRQRGEKIPSALDTLSMKLSFVLGRGKVDLLFIEKPFELARVTRVDRFLRGEAAAPVRHFLREVVARRGLFVGCQDLMEAVFSLGFGASLISRFARCAAAADGRQTVDARDIRDGISAAELLVFTHARLLSGSALTRLILRGLAANRLSYRNVLIAES